MASPDELRKLADECCAADNCTWGPKLVGPVMAEAIRDLWANDDPSLAVEIIGGTPCATVRSCWRLGFSRLLSLQGNRKARIGLKPAQPDSRTDPPPVAAMRRGPLL